MPSPISTSTIVAQAFRFMEVGPISSLGDDSPQAKDAGEQYPEALNLTLEAYDWGFARRLVILPVVQPEDDPGDPDLPGVFQLPSDCIVLRHVYPDDVVYRLDADGRLRADQTTPLKARYTSSQDNESRFPPAFKTAVAYQLAIRLGAKYLSNRGKISDLHRQFEQALRAAIQAEITNASPARFDGEAMAVDWACEATR